MATNNRPRATVITVGSRRIAGFTLVELLVVLAIIGILVGITLPAVQQSREAARRAQCANNMKNLALGLHSFHDSHRCLPPGQFAYAGLDHSWLTYILPHLEQVNVQNRMDLQRPWWDPQVNLPISEIVIPIFRCPSSLLDEPGDTDYAGISGSAASPKATYSSVSSNGCLTVQWGQVPEGVAFAEISDGLSATVLVAESADRLPTEAGRWADGAGVFICNGVVGTYGEIFSRHPGGANVAMADGSIRFLPCTLDKAIVGALCSRNEGD